jgi:hypothetical protein
VADRERSVHGDELPHRLLETVVLALARETHGSVAISRGPNYVDYSFVHTGPLGTPSRFMLRLFEIPASQPMLRQLHEEAESIGAFPIVIAAGGSSARHEPGIATIDGGAFAQLLETSAVLYRDRSGRPQVDRGALAELRDAADARIALLNGLAFLRPLSRNRVPQPLRWTRIPADDLFERSFFLVMVSTHHLRGESWGSRRRGAAIPDGVLEMPDADHPVLYDCKAAGGDGYAMSHRDAIAFADYLGNPPPDLWQPPRGAIPRFLIVSSAFIEGRGRASFQGRQNLLDSRVQGARLTWIRAPDLARFSMAIERARVRPIHRAQVDWQRLLDHGNVHWAQFAAELERLAVHGYQFDIAEA